MHCSTNGIGLRCRMMQQVSLFKVFWCLSVGYVYLVFENEKSVRALLHACSQDPFHPEDNREYYFKMSSRRMRCKDVGGNEACRALFTHCIYNL